MTLLMGTRRPTHRFDGMFYSAILKRKHGLETQRKQLILGGNTHATEMIIIMKLKHISAAKDSITEDIPLLSVFFFL